MKTKNLFVALLALLLVALPACITSDVEQMGTSNYTSDNNTFSGSVAVGDGTPSVTQDGEDLYVNDQFEVDGEAQFDGTIDANSTVDFAGAITCSYAGNCLTSATTADIEWLGFASIGNGTSNHVVDGTAESLYVEGSAEVDGTIYSDTGVVITKTTTANTYTDMVTSEWIAGADMAAGGSNGIYGISNPVENVSNAYALRGRMDLRDAAGAVSVNQLHAVDALINLNETQDYTLTDNVSVVGVAIHGGTSGDVVAGVGADPGSMNLYYGVYGPTATVNHSVQTNGMLLMMHDATYVDYGIQVQSSADMDAGLYLNSHASNTGAKMDVGVEMTSGASDMVYGIDMSAASFSGADIVGDNSETLDNGTDGAWVIGGFIAATEATVIDLGAGGTITPLATYQPLTNSTDGSITTDTTTAIADGLVVGAILILCNEDAQDIIIDDGANTKLSGNITLTGGNLDTLTLIWDGNDWIGIAMSEN